MEETDYGSRLAELLVQLEEAKEINAIEAVLEVSAATIKELFSQPEVLQVHQEIMKKIVDRYQEILKELAVKKQEVTKELSRLNNPAKKANTYQQPVSSDYEFYY